MAKAVRQLRRQFEQSMDAAVSLECEEYPESRRWHADAVQVEGGVEEARARRERTRSGVAAVNLELHDCLDAVEFRTPAAGRRGLDSLRTHANALEEVAGHRYPLPDEGEHLRGLGRRMTAEAVLAWFDEAWHAFRESVAGAESVSPPEPGPTHIETPARPAQ
ncbi:hypothetical protein [Kitasatospora sp. NPDC059327]|uniref:hypothetical protein n=1 Tax=Kitasatospora sp. NPDC059327 TaxID=3346803 RepID=UPI003697537D